MLNIADLDLEKERISAGWLSPDGSRKWFKFDGVLDCPADVVMAYFNEEGNAVWSSKDPLTKLPAIGLQPGFLWFCDQHPTGLRVELGEWIYYELSEKGAFS